jgi:unsaturated rhamnogalacturonyl hydrolase
MRYARNLTIVVPWVLLLVYIAMALPSVQGWDDTRGEASAVQKPQLSSAVADTAWSPDTHSESGVSATAVITEWHVYLPLTLRAYSFPPVTEWQPAFSPDGEQIVFVRQREGERSDVFLMNIDGSNVRNLTQTPEANEDTPTFSPDGAKIAFSSDREGHWNIYRMNLDGTGVEPVVSWAESDEMHPAFSPDGQYLAFSSNHEMGNWDLYSTTLTSGAWARLTTDPSVERFPVFSYSGSGLAYRREVDGDSEIYMLELVSRVARRLTTSPGGDSYPTLSPDGSGVVFVSNRSGDFQIYGMNIAGGGVFKLIDRPGYRAHTPRLSHDGRTLAYAAAPFGETYRIFTATYQSPLDTLASRGSADTLGLCDWTSGVFAVGWGVAWQNTGDDAYARKIQAWVDSCITDPYGITHVNDGLLGYASLLAYQFDPQPRYLTFAQDVADYLMYAAPRTTDGTLMHFEDTVWDDTLISVVPFFVEMERVTGDDAYLDEAVTQFVQHAAILQNAASDLYHHAWRESTGEYLSQAYWARGNSWNMIAATQLLDTLPPNHALWPQVVTIAQSHAQALDTQQHSSGLWHTVVNRPDFYLESSGSAGIGYGLRCGVQRGWLSLDLEESARTAWLGLWQKVSADGTLTDVSAQTGPMAQEEAYNAIPHDAMQLYGQGMGLLLLSSCLQ